MQIIRDNYQGRCFKGAYILSIESVLKNSDVEISQSHNDGRGFVFVAFKAQIIQREEGDLISSCKIERRQEGRLFAKTQYSNVILFGHDLIKILSKGDVIPIIVKKSRYTPLKDRISIFAVPFVPQTSAKKHMYVCNKNKMLTGENVKKLHSYLAQIAEIGTWMKKLSAADKKKFSIFEEIFYPFKIKRKPKLLENKNISLLDISTIKFEPGKPMKNIIMQCDEISRSQPFVLSASIESLESIKKTIKKNGSHWTVIFDSPYVIFEILYISHIKYLLFLKDMTIMHDLPKEKNIFWDSLKDYKQ